MQLREIMKMTIAVGDALPNTDLLKIGENGPEAVSVDSLTKGRKVVIFGVPGAFTPTCHSAHVPSFNRTKAQFAAKGVDDIICVSGNDPFVMKAWAEATGADAAGLLMLSDAAGEFGRALGLGFDAAPAGLYNRMQRFALYAEDGVVKVFHPEAGPGTCELSSGEAMLAAI